MANTNAKPSSYEIFVQGFFYRLIYGLSSLGILVLLRPMVFPQIVHDYWVALPFYLCICIAGGIRDAGVPQIEEKRLFRKITKKIVLWNLLGMIAFAMIVLHIDSRSKTYLPNHGLDRTGDPRTAHPSGQP